MKDLKELVEQISDEQKDIIYGNMFPRTLSGWWSQYKPGSLGNILHWAHCFIGFDCAEMCTVGQDHIIWHGEIIPFEYEGTVAYFDLDLEKHEWRATQQELFRQRYPEIPERFKDHSYIVQKHNERLAPPLSEL